MNIWGNEIVRISIIKIFAESLKWYLIISENIFLKNSNYWKILLNYQSKIDNDYSETLNIPLGFSTRTFVLIFVNDFT